MNLPRTVSLLLFLAALPTSGGCGEEPLPVPSSDFGGTPDRRRDASLSDADAGVPSAPDASDRPPASALCEGSAHDVAVFDRLMLAEPGVSTASPNRVLWLDTRDADASIDEAPRVVSSDIGSAILSEDGSPEITDVPVTAPQTVSSLTTLGDRVAFLLEEPSGPASVRLGAAASDTFWAMELSRHDRTVVRRVAPQMARIGDDIYVAWVEILDDLTLRLVARNANAAGSEPITLSTFAGATVAPPIYAIDGIASEDAHALVLAWVTAPARGTPQLLVQTFDEGSLAPRGPSRVLVENARMDGNLSLRWAERDGLLVWSELEPNGFQRLWARLLTLDDAGLPEAPFDIEPVTGPAERGTDARVASHAGGYAVAYHGRISGTLERSAMLAFIEGSSGSVVERVEVAGSALRASPIRVAATEDGTLVAAWYDVQMEPQVSSTLRTTTLRCPDLWLRCSPRP